MIKAALRNNKLQTRQQRTTSTATSSQVHMASHEVRSGRGDGGSGPKMYSSFLPSKMPTASQVGLGSGWSALVDRHDLSEAFAANPWGPHEAALQYLLNVMRSADVSRKLVLICTKPYREWMLARLPVKRGMPVEPLEGRIYTSLADAERAAFAIRWHEIFGRPLPASSGA